MGSLQKAIYDDMDREELKAKRSMKTKKRKKNSKPKRSEKQLRLDYVIQSFADHLRSHIQYELEDKLDQIESAFRKYARDFIRDYKEVELEFEEEE